MPMIDVYARADLFPPVQTGNSAKNSPRPCYALKV